MLEITEEIEVLSKKETSTVSIVMDAGKKLFIKKEFQDSYIADIYERIQELPSDYFPKIVEIQREGKSVTVFEEYLEGQPLSDKLENTISGEEAYGIVEQLLMAIQCLHSLDPPIIHRDIKPENILITGMGSVKLLDFDAARIFSESEKEKDTRLLGTRGYAAPEQFGFAQTDVRSDIYSAGVVCKMVVEKSDLSKDKKMQLAAVLDKATMFDPERRYVSAEEFLRELQKTGRKGRNLKLSVLIPVIVLLILAGIYLYKDSAGEQVESSVQEAAENISEGFFPDGYEFVYLSEYDHIPAAENKPAYYDEEKRIPFYRYFQGAPQAFLYFAPSLDGTSVVDISVNRYSKNGGKIVEKLRVLRDRYYTVENSCLWLDSEFLQGLQPGLYGLTVELDNEAQITIMMEIYGADESPDAYCCLETDTLYYSKSRKNDVLFEILTSGAESFTVYCNGEAVPTEYLFRNREKRVFTIAAEYLDAYTETDRIDILVETNDAKTAKGEILILP